MRPEDLKTSANLLDHAWAATRPADPSPEALDAFWARASSRIEVRPAKLRFHDDRSKPTGRRLRTGAIVGLVLVQAAAVLMAVGLRQAEAKVPRLETEVNQYAYVKIDEDGDAEESIHDDSSAVGPQMAQFTQHDLFNQAESMATP